MKAPDPKAALDWLGKLEVNVSGVPTRAQESADLFATGHPSRVDVLPKEEADENVEPPPSPPIRSR